MRKRGLTIRRLMAAVFVLAVSLRLGMMAFEVYQDDDEHTHAFVHMNNGVPGMTYSYTYQPPFWPRYWRRVLGRPWKHQSVCGRGDGRFAEACIYAHPELSLTGPDGMPTPGRTKEMDAVLERLGNVHRETDPIRTLSEP